MRIEVTGFDIVLILGVSTLVTVIAFVHQPRVKALVFSFPIPFSLANLALGQPVGAGHAIGLLNLLLFLNLVRWLHASSRISIVPAIAVSACAYVVVGAVFNRFLVETPASFWASFGAVVAVAVYLLVIMRPRIEPGHRSDLPVPVKFIAVAAVVTVVVILKGILGGFMTTFPLAGVVTVYEARKSLWTVSRQGPLLVLAIGCMMAVMRVSQSAAGVSVPLSLLPGLAAWIAVMAPITLLRWHAEDRGGGKQV